MRPIPTRYCPGSCMFLFDVYYREEGKKDVSFLYTSHHVVDDKLLCDLADVGITAKGMAIPVVCLYPEEDTSFTTKATETLITCMIRTAQHYDSNVRIGFVCDTLLENNTYYRGMAIYLIAI